MKKIAIILVGLFLVIAGCTDKGDMLISARSENVNIEREVDGINPSLSFICKGVELNYKLRKIRMIGLNNIFGLHGYYGNMVISKIEFDGNTVVVSIPSDANYHIVINKQYHLLPKIERRE